MHRIKNVAAVTFTHNKTFSTAAPLIRQVYLFAEIVFIFSLFHHNTKWGKVHTTEKNCKKQTTKKYTTRPSPPYPANQCKGKKKVGNDGKKWVSKANVTGIYTWRRV